MKNHYTIFRYIGTAAIVLLCIGLAGWYFFLRGQSGTLAGLDAARGFNIAVPSFTGTRSSTAENVAAGTSDESQLAQPGNERPPRLWKVSASPVAGIGFSANSMLRYVERSTGHIYEADLASGSVTRLTNALVPKVYEAALAGETIVMRTLEENGESSTRVGRLGTSTDDGFRRFVATDLGAPVRAITLSPANGEILTLTAGDTVRLVRTRSDGTSPQQLLSLGVGGFDISPLVDRRVVLTERPASGVMGSAYEVVNEKLVPLLRSTPGLMTLPRASSTALLFSADSGQGLALFVRPSENASVSELSLATVAQKCVWVPDPPRTSTSSSRMLAYCASPQTALPRNFVDAWLRGAAHTVDAWFSVDAGSAKVEKFFTPDSTIALDVERPIMDGTGAYIAFVNARDKSLWVLRVSDQ